MGSILKCEFRTGQLIKKAEAILMSKRQDRGSHSLSCAVVVTIPTLLKLCPMRIPCKGQNKLRDRTPGFA
ncbi:hypothetical protein D5086_010422 [Populus alba]|uniref:Uncharacterized protein n=1 Tax=Populus alba TaxID=43335 RepID=A0ACC4C9C9_POPAL